MSQITDNITKQINELYKKHDLAEIINKTRLALKLMLLSGMNTMDLTYKFIDIGVKPEELGLSMAIALSEIPDEYLNKIDVVVKHIVIVRHGKMIKELRKEL